jgi:hypothetical protein
MPNFLLTASGVPDENRTVSLIDDEHIEDLPLSM